MARQPKSNAGRKKQTDLYESYPSQKPRAVKPLATISAGKLIDIYPKTEPQRQMLESWASGLNICAVGSAGTGKTWIALWLALRELEENSDIKSIIILRSSVFTGRSSGFLPGNIDEKMAGFEATYVDTVNSLMGCGTSYESLKKRGVIKFMCPSQIRGLNIRNAIVIVDEVQSMNMHEISSIITRLTDTSRLIMCGDTKQNDLIVSKNDVSGLPDVISRINKMGDWFDVVNFLPQDIVRGGLVKAWILSED